MTFFSSVNIEYFLKNDPPPLDFVFDGLAAGTVGCIVSPGGVGKSFISLGLAMSVAAADVDERLLNLGISRHRTVAIFIGEDPTDILHQRIRSFSKLLTKYSIEDISLNLFINSRVGDRQDISNLQYQDNIIKQFVGYRLIVFDTFNRFNHFNENDNSNMSLVVSSYERIAKETGAAVLFLHHTNKGSTLNGQQESQQSSRGASAITDNCRYQAFAQIMTKEEAKNLGIKDEIRKKFVKFGASKSNYKETSERWLKRNGDGVLTYAPEVGTRNVIDIENVTKQRRKSRGDIL